ncbi:MAG: aminotransferase class V-fold PLP-dependent enzyme [Clostridia bacterium]|nr:aminotransferase class V-fold PLP-dependent enzyme [Clostridia bacterium]
MNTPICDFLEKYRDQNALRLHMPGHKGNGPLGIEKLDITEVEGADVLYQAKGIIKESMDNATRLFGTARTLYSTEGSSLSIKAMLYLAMLCRGDKKPLIAAGRNAHKVFMYGAALLDIDIDWLYGEGLLSCQITPEALEEYLKNNHPVAVYITSPDYLGNIADINGLSEVCRRHGVMLLVDNAHGAYLKFLPESKHPIDLGADICCDSAHKTLPCLTGAGYLHISKSAPSFLVDMADEAMSLFASTSPSYLIMYSLDKCNGYLYSGIREALLQTVPCIDELKQNLFTIGDEPMKLTLDAKKYGYTGIELSEIFAEQGIVTEFADPDYLVMMMLPDPEAAISVISVLVNINRRPPITDKPPKLKPLKSAMTPRQAMMSKSKLVDTDEALGRVLAAPSVSCPPAVPIAVCGEIIDENAIELFRYYGIDKIRVIE